MGAKSLQTPKIIEISGATIRIAHPDIKRNIATSLASPIAAAGTAMMVYDNNGFADDDWFIVGSIGSGGTEDCDVNGAVARGQAMTVTNTLAFPHVIDSPVTKIYERGVKIYGAATDGGAGTLIASIDAITASGKRLAKSVMIQWEKPYTEYTLISTDTAYAYYYAEFTDGTTASSRSTYIPSTGVAYNKIEPLMTQATNMTNTRIDGKRLTREMFVDWANDCQNAITQFVYHDGSINRLIQKDWSFEVVADETITLVEGEDKYSLSGLNLKYPNSEKSIIDIAIIGEKPMEKMAIKDYDIHKANARKTYLNGALAVGDTTITVDSTANFASSGNVLIAGQVITYTGVTSTTFTGVPASGSGSITAIIADKTVVWQGLTTGQPSKYVIFNGDIYFNSPASATFKDRTVKVRYFKALDRITSVSDSTEVPFTNVFSLYFVGMIFYRLGQIDSGIKFIADFKEQVRANAVADTVPQQDEWTYYEYDNDFL